MQVFCNLLIIFQKCQKTYNSSFSDQTCSSGIVKILNASFLSIHKARSISVIVNDIEQTKNVRKYVRVYHGTYGQRKS